MACPTDAEVDAVTFDWGEASESLQVYEHDVTSVEEVKAYISSAEKVKAFIAANCTETSATMVEDGFPADMCMGSVLRNVLDLETKYCQDFDSGSCDGDILVFGGECLSASMEFYGVSSQATNALRSAGMRSFA